MQTKTNINDRFLRYFHSVGKALYRSKSDIVRDGLRDGMRSLRLQFLEGKAECQK